MVAELGGHNSRKFSLMRGNESYVEMKAVMRSWSEGESWSEEFSQLSFSALGNNYRIQIRSPLHSSLISSLECLFFPVLRGNFFVDHAPCLPRGVEGSHLSHKQNSCQKSSKDQPDIHATDASSWPNLSACLPGSMILYPEYDSSSYYIDF